METVHLNGQFLPWHRYFTAVYEDALRVQCGFGGAQPWVPLFFIIFLCFSQLMVRGRYWDWTLDADGVWAESPVFSAVDGFGGNGVFTSFHPPSPFMGLLTTDSRPICTLRRPTLRGLLCPERHRWRLRPGRPVPQSHTAPRTWAECTPKRPLPASEFPFAVDTVLV